MLKKHYRELAEKVFEKSVKKEIENAEKSEIPSNIWEKGKIQLPSKIIGLYVK